jgi:hypothetical protein
MANLKISQLPVSSDLTGAEILADVQGGTTKRTTISDIATFTKNSSGNLNVTGSTVLSGSVSSPPNSPPKAPAGGGWTHTITPSQGNYFEITLVSSVVNTIAIDTSSAAIPGQTINLKLTQASSPGTISWSSYIKFADGSDTTVSTGANDIDIFSLITYDGSTFFANGLKNFS